MKMLLFASALLLTFIGEAIEMANTQQTGSKLISSRKTGSDSSSEKMTGM